MELKDSPERPPRLEKFKQCVANFNRLFNKASEISKPSMTSPEKSSSIKTSCSDISFIKEIEDIHIK
jgi:hypothetical protein